MSPQTIRRYIDVLGATFAIRVLRPLLQNTKKRLVKAPKVYVRDTGILHALLSVETDHTRYGHIQIGASWESYVVEQPCSVLTGWECSFRRTSAGVIACTVEGLLSELSAEVTLNARNWRMVFYPLPVQLRTSSLGIMQNHKEVRP